MKQNFDLQYFAEEAAAEASADTATSGVEEGQVAAVQSTGAESEQQAAAVDNTDYASAIAGLSDDQRTSLFDSLMKNDKGFKGAVDSYAQKAVSGRVSKLERDHQAEISKYGNLMRNAKELYGTDDVDEIASKMLDDDRLYAAEAAERGVDVSVVKREHDLTRREKAIQQQEQERHDQQRFVELDRKWRGEAETLKATYPDFDFDAVMGNPETGEQMLTLLMGEMPLKKAYESVFFDDLMQKARTAAADEAKKATVDTIKARGMRPAENGTGSQAPAQTKIDVNNLTDAQMDEFIARSARGEKITFS